MSEGQRGHTASRPRIYAFIGLLIAASFVIACGDSSPPPPTLNPDLANLPITQARAIEIAKASLSEVIEDIEFAGYEDVRVRVGNMRLSYLQELTNSALYSPDSPRMQRQIWAIQIGGKFPTDPRPYTVDHGYGIVGIDAINGDIHLRARYDKEILVEP